MLFLKNLLLRNFQGCCLLFNYQGSSLFLLIRSSFDILSHRFPFVKNFFQKLFSFFQVLSSARSWSSITAALAGDLIRIPHSVRLVKNFFKFFKLFSSSFGLWLGRKKRSALTDRLCWHYLSFRPVSRQVFSAEASLTSVFGMGTGGPSP